MNSIFPHDSDERLHLQARLEDYNAYTDEILQVTQRSHISERVAAALEHAAYLDPTGRAEKTRMENSSHAKATKELAHMLVREQAALITPIQETLPVPIPQQSTTEHTTVRQAA